MVWNRYFYYFGEVGEVCEQVFESDKLHLREECEEMLKREEALYFSFKKWHRERKKLGLGKLGVFFVESGCDCEPLVKKVGEEKK